MNSIGEDMIFEILCHLDAISSTHLLSTKRRFWNIRTIAVVSSRIAPYQKLIRQQRWNAGMILSIDNHHEAQMMYFIEKGANNWNGALCAVVRHSMTHLIDFFIAKGALIEEGLFEAVRFKHMELVELLLSRVLNNSAYCKKMDAVLNVCLLAACAAGAKDLVHKFMELGADNWTGALNEAAVGGHKDLVELFVDKIPSKSLCHAAEGGNMEIVNLLIQKGATDFVAALKYAARGGHKEVIDFLITKGASDWNYALVYAANGGHKDLVEFFVNKGATSFEFAQLSAISQGHTDLVLYLLTKGIDVNEAMAKAAACDQFDMVDELMKLGANNLNKALRRTACTEPFGEVGPEHLDMIRYLIRLGAKDVTGALLAASLRRIKDVAKVLIQHGADVNLALRNATEGAHSLEILEFLIELGATDLDRPCMIAAEENLEDVVKFFIERGATNGEEATQKLKTHILTEDQS